MAKSAKLINGNDNVVTVVADCTAGDEVTVCFEKREATYKCNQDVPFGHKVAICDIGRGESVIKYGAAIGSATQDIRRGDWVHIHNLKDDYKVLDKEGNPLPGQED